MPETEQSWVESTPANACVIADFPALVRILKQQLRFRQDKEHNNLGDSGAGGDHVLGSANIYVVDDAEARAAVAYRPDGATLLDADDNGRLLFQIDTGELYKWTTDTWAVIEFPNSNLKNTEDTDSEDPTQINGAVDTDVINDNAITTDKIIDEAITTDKIIDEAVTIPKLKDTEDTDPGVDTTQINGAVDTDVINDNAITTDKIVDEAITEPKMANGAAWVVPSPDIAFDGVGDTPIVYTDLDLSSIIGARSALVMLLFENGARHDCIMDVKRKGDVGDVATDTSSMTRFQYDLNQIGYVMMGTDSAGIIQWKCNSATAGHVIHVVGYVK